MNTTKRKDASTCVDVAEQSKQEQTKVFSTRSVSKQSKGGSSLPCLFPKTADDEEETLPQPFGGQFARNK